MYVIATVSCPNFHFSVSPHVPFLKLLFEQIANSNEYSFVKIGVKTAENEPLKVHLIFQPWDRICTKPPRPGAEHGRLGARRAREGLALLRRAGADALRRPAQVRVLRGAGPLR